MPSARLLLLCLFVLILAACGKDEPAQTGAPTQTAAQPTKAKARPEGFVLMDAGTEVWEQRAVIFLEFSQPLVDSQDFNALVAVSDTNGGQVSGGWILDEEARRLRFPVPEAQKSYRVVVPPELSDREGRLLKSRIERIIEAGTLPPSFAFASQGNVLPAGESEGLPVISVNVAELDVEFFRLREDALSAFFINYPNQGGRGYWELNQIAQMGESVYSNRFSLDGPANQRSVSHLPLQQFEPLRAPGLYFAVARRAGDFNGYYQTAWYFVSDIGLHARVHKDGLWVHAASLRTGKPQSEVQIQVLDRKGQSLFDARTDANGHVKLAYQPVNDHVLIARRGPDVSMFAFNQPALDLSEFDVAGGTADWASVFIWSGRDLYRPGETVRVSALLRDFDGRQLQRTQPLFGNLLRPDGRVHASFELTADEFGYYEWSRNLPADVPTGRWTLELRLEPKSTRVHSYALRIEEFLPERLKLVVDSASEQIAPGQPLPVLIEADYLYGAPAAGNRITAKLDIAADPHPVAARKDFYFGDLVNIPKRDPQDVIDTTLDEQGRYQGDIALGLDTVNGPIAARVFASVFETGGRAVSRSLSRTVWPADKLVGVRPLFDPKEAADANATVGFELVRSDRAGDALEAKGLQVRLIHEQRDYFWRNDPNSGWRYDFVQRFVTAHEQTVDLDAGEVSKLALPVTWGSYRLEVTDPETGLTSRYPFNAGWGWGDENRGLDARPDKVKVALDKTHYRAGDTLTATLTPPHAGPAVVLVETDELLHVMDLDVEAGTRIEIPVDERWERHDVYLTVLVFRPGAARDLVTPSRAVGIAHVPMQRVDRKVEVAIESPETMRPNQKIPVRIKAEGLAGQTARLTVSAVDVGILNITNFAVPDAFAHFFAKRRHAVGSWDIYGRVVEFFAGVRARLRYGGDAALAGLPQARRPTAKVLTVDLFSGPVSLDANGEASVELSVPDFNGALRVSTLVFGTDRYGSASRETIVRAPLVAEVSTPRVMAPGDRSKLTLDLTNFSDKDQQLEIKVIADDLLEFDGGELKLALADKARNTLSIPMRAANGYGTGKFRVKVTGDGIDLERSFELVVRSPWPSIRRSSYSVQEQPVAVSLDASSVAEFLPGSVVSRLSVSSLPPLPFADAVRGLDAYPYGCLEQTSSRAYPLIWMDNASAKAVGLPLLDNAERGARLDMAFSRLSGMQNSDGHFSFWGGADGWTDVQMTPYLVELLLNARDAGFSIPEAMLDRSLERLSNDFVGGGHYFWEYEQSNHLRYADNAYMGYVLARVQKAPLGTLRALWDRERSNARSPLANVRMGIALTLMGDAERGTSAIEEALSATYEYPRYIGDYGTQIRDWALSLALLHEHGLAKPEHSERVFALSQDVKSRTWFSTQEQVALFRLGRMLLREGQNPFKGVLRVGSVEEPFGPGLLFSRELVGEDLAAGARFTPEAKGRLYVSRETVGHPLQAPEFDDKTMSVQRQWYRTDGSLFEGDTLTEGETLIAYLKVESSEEVRDALVIDLVPGGLEVENLNLTDASQWANTVIAGINLSERQWSATIRNEEYRDDRYVAAIHAYAGQTAHLFYLVRAVSPGEFTVPAPYVEDMYRPDLRGLGKAGGRIKVAPPAAKPATD